MGGLYISLTCEVYSKSESCPIKKTAKIVKKETGILVETWSMKGYVPPFQGPMPIDTSLYLPVTMIKYLERGIIDMKDGEIAYVVPWTIYKTDRFWWRKYISDRCIAHYESGGAASVRIKKQGNIILVNGLTLIGEKISSSEFVHRNDIPVRISLF
jgi:hypothetical protein